jgi:hypothetical protein
MLPAAFQVTARLGLRKFAIYKVFSVMQDNPWRATFPKCFPGIRDTVSGCKINNQVAFKPKLVGLKCANLPA